MGLSRRSFLKTGAAGGVTVLGSGAAMTLLSGCPDAEPNTSFTAHQKETLCAAADAIVPGWYYVGQANGGQVDGGGGTKYTSDGTNGGAVQAGAWDVFWDQYYQINGWIDEVTPDLDANGIYWYGGSTQYKHRSLAQRSYVITGALAGENARDGAPWYVPVGSYTPIYRGLLLMTKLAFFGAQINTIGWTYIGYPGAAASYAAEASNPYP
jgi:hypothetical protein